ncbi:MAG TPA: hypothetical protein VHW45_20210 [Candidatus Sulfotelmatobacter sp.]|jgi:Flp pilus assembly protein TadD|nr:hypothetical protein [Candidatus Sulfotelmatobacter sp.]
MALLELETAARLAPDIPSVVASLGYANSVAGRRTDARKILEKLATLRPKTYVPATDLAAISVSLGEKDEAFRWLEEAFQERAVSLTWVKSWPPFGPIRDDPRFAELLHRIGLD